MNDIDNETQWEVQGKLPREQHWNVKKRFYKGSTTTNPMFTKGQILEVLPPYTAASREQGE